MKAIVKQVLRENEQKAKAKCFNCGKSGHFQNNYKASQNRSRLVSQTRRRVERSGREPQDRKDHLGAKIPKIEPKSKKRPTLWKLKKNPIVVVQRMQFETNDDWCAAQRSDPILAKIIAAKEEDK